MDTVTKLPFYVKATLFLVGLYAFISMLSLAQDIILPLIYATIVAILMSPAVNFLVKKKVNRTIAVTIIILITFLVVGGIIASLASQASLFQEAWPKLMDKLKDLLAQTEAWVAVSFNIEAQKIDTWITDVTTEFIKNRNAAIGVTLTSAGGILSATVLTPVYIFMILYYQPHLLEFTHKVFGAGNDNKVSEILSETKAVIQKYIAGLFFEFIIIAILNSAGLLALKIQYAILLGVIGAMLNVIPIIGGIICVALFVIIALLTKSPIYVLYVVGLYTLIQFIDDHYIFPKIVGSKVKLNVLISVVAVILGDALWGVPGMFLAIPLMAISKLIFDRIHALEAWGFLLGATAIEGETAGSFSITTLINYFTSKIHKKK
jgi:predicted PurR-regulated permease PerM